MSILLWIPLFTTVFFVGCSPCIDSRVPEPIRPFQDPEYDRPYLLYRPSTYTNESNWPLVIVCHGAYPDSPDRQIRAWDQLAEAHGFLVAAPKLSGSGRKKNERPDQNDEALILSIVQHLRGSHSISDDRIFLHGAGRGAQSALRVGLRNPDVFRAITLSAPRLEEGLLADVASAIDPHQPIYLHYKSSDPISGKDGRRCADWLRARGADVHDDSIGPAKVGEARRPVAFLEDVIRRRPWVRIIMSPSGTVSPREFQFHARCSFPPKDFRWAFGDGDESTVAEPVHRYAAPGSYQVKLRLSGTGLKPIERTLDVVVR